MEGGTTAIPAPTDAALEKFGRELAHFVNDGEPAKMADTMNLEAFMARVMHGHTIEGINLLEVGQHFAGSFKKSLVTWKQGRFVRVSTINGEKRVLIRVISGNGDVNFLDWVCVTQADGSIKTVDLLSYLTAELASDTFWHVLLPLYGEKHPEVLEHLTPGERELSWAIPKMKHALDLLRSGNAEKALSVVEDLPDEVKLTPSCLLERLQIARAIDNDETYLKVISDWEDARPGDPALDVISLPGNLIRKDYVRCIHNIETFQRQVGADGYLQALKATIHLMAGSAGEAHAAILESIAREPDLMSSYDTWFDIELQAENWPNLTAALTTCEKNFPTVDTYSFVMAEDKWAPFRKTGEGKAWIRQHAQK